MADEDRFDKDNILNDDEVTVTLSLDDGTEVDCSILTIFQAGEKDYIALLPLNGPDAENGNVYLYRYVEHENGDEPDLENIVDDDEYDLVSDAFDEYLDSVEFDELITEDEDDDDAE